MDYSQHKQDMLKNADKYKGYIVRHGSIWFDEPYWYDCNPYQIFISDEQAREYINKITL